MERFIIIAYDHYYPFGFPYDIRESTSTLEEAIERLVNYQCYDHVYIFDCDKREIVKEINNWN